MAEQKELPHDSSPDGGWGSMKGISQMFGETWSAGGAVRSLGRMSKPKNALLKTPASKSVPVRVEAG